MNKLIVYVTLKSKERIRFECDYIIQNGPYLCIMLDNHHILCNDTIIASFKFKDIYSFCTI